VLRGAPGKNNRFLNPWERLPWAVFFLGIGFTAFGSSYYHLAPDNDRLLWDRLPMAVAFMSLFSAVLCERINIYFGVFLLPILVGAGIASVWYWHWTEQLGRGDLRFYYLVQFYSLLVMALLLVLFPPRYTCTSDFVVALGLYVLAKVCEHPLDGPIFSFLLWISGHALKHLTAALAAWWMAGMLWQRRPSGK
jgi:hypothetical protein